MRNRLPHPALLRRLLAAAGVGLAVGFAFIAFFTSALHDPKPNAMRVGVVGPPPAAAEVERQLSRAMPGAFDVHRYADEREATDAIREQDIAGAFIPGPHHPRLLIAGADGASVTTVLRAAFGAAAAAGHHDLTVTDLAPLPAHDARGISAFFVVAGTTLGSLVFGIVLFFGGGHALTTPLGLRLTFIGGFSVAAGVVMASATELVADGLGDHFWRVAGIAALLAAVISLITTALVRWFGTPGVALSALFVMLFSLPATGGAIGPEFVPGIYRDIAPALPSHAALVAVKGAVYFQDGGVTGGLAILAAWAVAALLAQIAAHILRGHPVPPATGSPLDRAGDASFVGSTASPRDRATQRRLRAPPIPPSPSPPHSTTNPMRSVQPKQHSCATGSGGSVRRRPRRRLRTRRRLSRLLGRPCTQEAAPGSPFAGQSLSALRTLTAADPCPSPDPTSTSADRGEDRRWPARRPAGGWLSVPSAR